MGKVTFTIFFLIFSTILLVGCSDDDKNEEEIIPTSNFILNTPFYWKLPNDKDVVYVVNSQTEIHQHIDKDDITEIVPNMPDLDKTTLLLTKVAMARGISEIGTRLIKYNNTDYTLEIHITLNEAMVAENRIVAVTVPKLSNNTKVTKRYILYAPM